MNVPNLSEGESIGPLMWQRASEGALEGRGPEGRGHYRHRQGIPATSKLGPRRTRHTWITRADPWEAFRDTGPLPDMKMNSKSNFADTEVRRNQETRLSSRAPAKIPRHVCQRRRFLKAP